MTDLSDQPLRRLAKILDWKPSPASLKKLKALDDQHRLGLERLNELSVQAVARLYSEAVARSEASLRSATTTKDLQEIGLVNKQTLLAQLTSQRSALKEGLRNLTSESQVMIKPLFEDFLTKATVHISELRDAEIQIASGYGCRHLDSATIAQLNESLALLDTTFRYKGSYAAPSQTAEPLFDL